MTISPVSHSKAILAELQVRDDEVYSSQVLRLSTALWEQLTASDSTAPSISSPPSKKLAVSVYPTKRRGQQSSMLPALTFYAEQDFDSSTLRYARASRDVARRLRLVGLMKMKGNLLQVMIQQHTLLSISTTYLSATSSSGFELAQARQNDIVHQLDGQILRQGDLLRLDLGSVLLPLRIVMTEPLLQGIFSAELSQVLLTVDEGADESFNGDDSFVSESSVSAGSMTDDGIESVGNADGLDDDDDNLSIDERYLADTVLEDFSQLDISVEPSAPSHHTLQPRDTRNKAVKSTICALHTLHDSSLLEDAIAFWRAQRLTQAYALAGDAAANESLDEDNIILTTEKGMASMGAFNGDWATASVPSGSLHRIVRVFAAPHLAATDQLMEVWMPPTLIQNIFGDKVFSSSSTTVSIRILGIRAADSQQEVSALARTCPVPLPFADSLTIARVAGPLSVDRAYQGLFLDALRTYFEERRRICRSGDVIAVAIEANKARFAKKELEQETSSDSVLEDIHDLRLPSDSGSVKTATVYFRISDIKPELTAPAQVSSLSYSDEAHRNLSLQAQTGSLGCVVDPNVTAMVQTGVEQCRVVDCDHWLGVVSETPDLPFHKSAYPASPLLSKAGPYATISSLLNATLQNNSDRFGLHLSVLLRGARGTGKKTVVRWVAKTAGVQLVEIDCFDLVSDSDARTEGILRAKFQKASECAPGILLLRNIEALARKSQALETGQEPPLATALQSCFEELRNATSELSASSNKTAKVMPVAVFGTTSDPEKCPTGVLGCFKHEVTFGAPNEAERREILDIALQGSALSPDVDVKNLATQTAALVAADLVDLVSRAKYAAVARVRKASSESSSDASDLDLLLAGMILTGNDFEQALSKARSSYSESIGAPKIPNVTWDDVGGLASVKSDILDTIQLPLEHPELFSDGLKKRSGILLYGPPGTGKTLLAKAVATSCSLNFFSVKGPELLNMYIGESEANVRRVFQRARDAKPCVIFFDELDSVAPKRGNQGDSGGVMDRIVSQLLAELDGMAGSSEGTDVFVIGATNRPDLLDPALLRPGRFDRMLYLSVSETHAAQLNILQALTRKFKLDEDLGDLSCIAEQCPFNLTGADFYALCSDSMLKAMTRKASEVDQRIADINATPGPKDHPTPLTAQYYLAEMAKQEEIEVKVNRRDFEMALKELTPSVSEQEMQHYREVQAKFSTPKKQDEKVPPVDQHHHHQQQEQLMKGDSIQDKARRAIEELGYALQPVPEKPDPNSNSRENHNLSPSPLPQSIRTSPSPSHTSLNGSSLNTSLSNGTGKGKGKGKTNEVDTSHGMGKGKSKAVDE